METARFCYQVPLLLGQGFKKVIEDNEDKI
jgi:hypothetical protein